MTFLTTTDTQRRRMKNLFFQYFRKKKIRLKRVWHFFLLKNQNSSFFLGTQLIQLGKEGYTRLNIVIEVDEVKSHQNSPAIGVQLGDWQFVESEDFNKERAIGNRRSAFNCSSYTMMISSAGSGHLCEHLDLEHKFGRSLERYGNCHVSDLHSSQSTWMRYHSPKGYHYHGLPSTKLWELEHEWNNQRKSWSLNYHQNKKKKMKKT